METISEYLSLLYFMLIFECICISNTSLNITFMSNPSLDIIVFFQIRLNISLIQTCLAVDLYFEVNSSSCHTRLRVLSLFQTRHEIVNIHLPMYVSVLNLSRNITPLGIYYLYFKPVSKHLTGLDMSISYSAKHLSLLHTRLRKYLYFIKVSSRNIFSLYTRLVIYLYFEHVSDCIPFPKPSSFRLYVYFMLLL